MATVDDIAELRRLVDEQDIAGEWTDVLLGSYLDTYGVTGAAARVWSEKAANYASLVNVSESGSSRAMGSLYQNALKMAEFYQRGGPIVPPAGSSAATQVNSIVRRTSPEP